MQYITPLDILSGHDQAGKGCPEPAIEKTDTKFEEKDKGNTKCAEKDKGSMEQS